MSSVMCLQLSKQEEDVCGLNKCQDISHHTNYRQVSWGYIMAIKLWVSSVLTYQKVHNTVSDTTT